MLPPGHPDLRGLCCLSPKAMVSSKTGLLHKVISGSVAQQKPGSELMSRAPVVTKGHAEDQGLVGHLGYGYDIRV